MTDVVFVETTLVVMVKVVDVLPAGIVTLPGTVATDVLALERVTDAPPAGATPLSLTVAVEFAPPVTDAGLSIKLETTAEVIVRVAFAVVPKVAAITDEVLAATPLVVIANVVDVLPTGTVTLTGTVAAVELLLESVTKAPPIGAAPLIVTVPVEGFPPITLPGFRVTDDAVNGVGVTPRFAVTVVP